MSLHSFPGGNNEIASNKTSSLLADRLVALRNMQGWNDSKVGRYFVGGE